jgi:hypothetical protein
MLKPIAFSLLVAVAALLMFFGYRVWPKESEIVGTWEYSGLDAVRQITLRPDHTVSDYWPEMGEKEEDGMRGVWHIAGPRPTKIDGKWRISEPGVFVKFDMKAALNDPSAADQSGVMGITQFRENRRTTDRPYFVRVR